MDFDFTSEELAMREEARRFAAAVLAPRAAHFDATGEFPFEHIAPLADFGAMGLNLPEAYGGAGASPLSLVLVFEEMTAACAATVSAVGAHYLATDAILLGGGEEIKRRLLPAAATGKLIGAYALTEPDSGSDAAAMKTQARPEGNGWRLRGTKHFITNGAEADFVVVFARTDPEAGHRGVSAFVVDKGTPGFAVSRHDDIMGIRASRIYELTFDCLVPAANLVGPQGSGFATAMAVLDRGRIEVAAMGLGLARAALEAAIAWAKERAAFGRKIAEYQGIQWMLADMATELDAARLLTYRAAWLRGKGAGRFAKESAMAKLFASEMAGRVADLALQIHGGHGYTRALPLERYVRDARILRIFEGSSEVQRNIIARHLLT
ncbi:MAG: acyl-CoA dehydrogenase family protein [Pseudomonadota bacterium]